MHTRTRVFTVNMPECACATLLYVCMYLKYKQLSFKDELKKRIGKKKMILLFFSCHRHASHSFDTENYYYSEGNVPFTTLVNIL